MTDDDLIFADNAEEALSQTQPMKQVGPPVAPTGERRPPPEELALRPHCLVSPVLQEPLLLARSRKYVIGRDEEADIRIKTDKVSRRHAEVYWDGKCFVVIDLNSTNGSELNHRQLVSNKATPLYDNDRLSFGGYEVKVNVLAPGEFPEENLRGVTRKLNRD